LLEGSVQLPGTAFALSWCAGELFALKLGVNAAQAMKTLT
jgi:hypothetical protein